MNVTRTTRRNSGGGAEEAGREGSVKVLLHRRDMGIAVAKSLEHLGPLWATPVIIGNQEFTVVIDTGSVDR